MLVPYTRRRKAERLVDMAGVDVTWAGPPPPTKSVCAIGIA